MIFERGAVNLLLSFWVKVFHFPSCIYRGLLVQLEKNKCSEQKWIYRLFLETSLCYSLLWDIEQDLRVAPGQENQF